MFRLFVVLFCFYNITAFSSELKEILSYKKDDIIIGDPEKAKVIVITYTAYSCPHCADFMSDILPKLKKNYFQNKSVAYIQRGLPAISSDVYAKQLVICSKLTNSDKLKFNEMLYSTASDWAYSTKPKEKLVQIARLFGLKDKEIAECFNSVSLEKKIISERNHVVSATKLVGIPAIIVNEKILSGYNYNLISDAIDNALKNKK